MRLSLAAGLLSTSAALMVPGGGERTARRAVLASLPPVLTLAFTCVADCQKIVSAAEAAEAPVAPSAPKFRRVPTQFIAALGDPKASSGTGAETWGLWVDDPGPQGVFLKSYESKIVNTGGKTPAGWKFDERDWWLEEHGLIMPGPSPLPAKKFEKETKNIVPARRYVVTGDRELTTVLTVHDDGRWELAKGALYDVTHLPCRSARYTPAEGGTCTPAQADRAQFPVKPGAAMPAVPSCAKQDYAVLFVVAIEA